MRHSIWFVRMALWILIMAVLSACRTSPGPSEIALPGTVAPDFNLSAVRENQEIRLSDLHGQAVLIAFLNTRAGDGQDPSDSQVVFLRSMQAQFGGKRMLTLVIDASWLVTGELALKDDLINYSHDHQLESIPLLTAQDIEPTLDSYGIIHLPTTLLVDDSGIIRQRWDGYASASQLSLALEAEIGAPFYRDQTVTFPNATDHATCENETPAQARFAGLGLARPLSDAIWLVDGGQEWKANQAFPQQWLVIDQLAQTRGKGVQLRVVAMEMQSDDHKLVIDQLIEPLPADEATALSAGAPTSSSSVYLLATTVNLKAAGCYKIEAAVSDPEAGESFYQGEAFVFVE